MAYQYPGRFAAMTSTSTSTSAPFFVGDFRLVSVSFSTTTTLSPSRFTVQGSNADGLQAADLGGSTSNLNWSLVTGVNMVGVTPGMITFDPPGYRWMRVTIDSVASLCTITMAGESF